jgi:hypothetical protein
MAIEKQELINKARLFMSELKKENPEKESLEWYLINNLRRYLNALDEARTAEQIKVATYVFRRFYLESMDWDTPLFKQCSNLSKIGSRVAKN